MCHTGSACVAIGEVVLQALAGFVVVVVVVAAGGTRVTAIAEQRRGSARPRHHRGRTGTRLLAQQRRGGSGGSSNDTWPLARRRSACIEIITRPGILAQLRTTAVTTAETIKLV